MSTFFALLAAVALIAGFVYGAQALRLKKGRSARAGLSFVASLIFVGLSNLTDRPSPTPTQSSASAWNNSTAMQMVTLITSEGLECISASTGKTCSGTVNGLGNIDLALAENRETLIISDPQITATQIAPELTEIPHNNIQIAEGPLAGYYISRTETNTSSQLTIRNEASHQMYGN